MRGSRLSVCRVAGRCCYNMNNLTPPRLLELECSSGVILRVREWAGTGANLLFIHGSGDGSYVWSHAATALCPAYRCLAVDLRGHGDSNWDPDGGYAIETYVADVTRALHAFCPEPAILVGHSLGGDIAIRVAGAAAERVRALVVVDFGLAMNRDAIDLGRDRFLKLFRTYSSVDDYETVIQDERPLAAPAMVKLMATHGVRNLGEAGYSLKCDPAIAATPYEPDDATLQKLLARIQCPVMVVRGAGSAMFSRQSATRMVRSMRRGALREVESAGHGLIVDNPPGFLAVLRAFLRDHPPQRTVRQLDTV